MGKKSPKMGDIIYGWPPWVIGGSEGGTRYYTMSSKNFSKLLHSILSAAGYKEDILNFPE